MMPSRFASDDDGLVRPSSFQSIADATFGPSKRPIGGFGAGFDTPHSSPPQKRPAGWMPIVSARLPAVIGTNHAVRYRNAEASDASGSGRPAVPAWLPS